MYSSFVYDKKNTHHTLFGSVYHHIPSKFCTSLSEVTVTTTKNNRMQFLTMGACEWQPLTGNKA